MQGLLLVDLAIASDRIVILRWGDLNNVFWSNTAAYFFEEFRQMAEGTIKRLTDKGFGFIDTGSNKDMFFHMSNLEGVSFDELQEGQRVEYTEGNGPKGPRAENVKPI